MFIVTASCGASSDVLVRAALWSERAKILVPVGAIGLSTFTFFLGYRQRDRERTLSYYHKTVTDAVMPAILEFFPAQLTALEAAAIQALQPSARRTKPISTTKTLSTFSTQLFDLHDSIVERTVLFDEKATSKINKIFEEIEDSVSEWFDNAMQKKKSIDQLKSIVRSGQRRVVRGIYEGQFRDFGNLRRLIPFEVRWRQREDDN